MEFIKGLAFALHIISAMVWIGGMFFAYMALRPAAGMLEPEHRLSLWARTLSAFFPWVIIAIVILFSTGIYFITGPNKIPMTATIHIMVGLGTVMTLIFFHVFFAPFKKLKQNVIIKDWPAGAKNLAQIRMLVGINLIIGLVLVATVVTMKYM